MRQPTIPTALLTTRLWTAALIALAGLGSPAIADEALTAEQVVEKHIAATGGRDAALAMKSARATGVMVLESGAERPFTWWFKRPLRMRIEVAMPGMTLIHAFDGKEGASAVLPAGSSELQRLSLGEDEIEQMRDSADLDGPLFDFAAKGIGVELVGKSDLDGRAAYELKVTKPSGLVQRLFLDAETFLIRRQVTVRPQLDGEVTIFSFFRDHKWVSGVLMAHTIEQRNEGAEASAVTTLHEIVTNLDVPDAFFTLAEATAAKPPG